LLCITAVLTACRCCTSLISFTSSIRPRSASWGVSRFGPGCVVRKITLHTEMVRDACGAPVSRRITRGHQERV
jgi:hypothetical protein